MYICQSKLRKIKRFNWDLSLETGSVVMIIMPTSKKLQLVLSNNLPFLLGSSFLFVLYWESDWRFPSDDIVEMSCLLSPSNPPRLKDSFPCGGGTSSLSSNDSAGFCKPVFLLVPPLSAGVTLALLLWGFPAYLVQNVVLNNCKLISYSNDAMSYIPHCFHVKKLDSAIIS